jgi:hypothetical protein
MAVGKKQIHIVGSVDVNDGAGQILYVNPTTAPTADAAVDGPAGAVPEPATGTGFELVVEDADGKELQRLRPPVLRPSDAGDSSAGLIDVRIIPTEGMARLQLLYDGKLVDTFEAGAPAPVQAGPGPMADDGDVALGPMPGEPAKRQLTLDEFKAEKGVSYTVQVRPAGEGLWQTVAVGRATPEVVIDANQYPGAESATVRVVRSTGFDDTVVAEGDIDLTYEN